MKTSSIEKPTKHSSSTKWIWGLVILAFLIILGGAGLYWKVVLPWRVENYANKSIQDYNHLQEELKETGEDFEQLSILNSNQLKKFTNQVRETNQLAENIWNTEKERRFPSPAKKLHQNLIDYYSDVVVALEGIESITEYFDKLVPITKNLEQATTAIKSQNNDSEEISQELKTTRKKLQSVYQNLKKLKALPDLRSLHQNLTHFVKIMVTFVSDTIEAFEAEDADQIEQLVDQLEKDQENYSEKLASGLDKFEKHSQITQSLKGLTDQETMIGDELSLLKSKYHF
jgi:phage shock protein A